MTSAVLILISIGAYLAMGLGVGLAFVAGGVARVDHAARGAPLGFRLVILPGCVALWPLIAARWRRALREGSAGGGAGGGG